MESERRRETEPGQDGEGATEGRQKRGLRDRAALLAATCTRSAPTCIEEMPLSSCASDSIRRCGPAKI